MPFTYSITWSQFNIHYYGVRWAKNSKTSDLMKTYFTSSKYVKNFINENGMPDIIKIRKEFINKESAIEWEHKFLSRVDAAKNPRFLNKSNGNAMFSGVEPGSKRGKYNITEEDRNRRSVLAKKNLVGCGKPFQKNHVPWNKGTKGKTVGWSKGLTKEESESLRNVSEKMKAFRQGKEPWNKGKSTGQIPWNKGLTKDTNNKLKQTGEKIKDSLHKVYSSPDYKHKTYIRTEEIINKFRETKKRNAKPPKTKKCLINGITYPSINAAMAALNISYYLVRKSATFL